ncbi:MAG: TonB-dependent receptor [Comamonadaceae bacterium]|nr:MAG: TonB-dependent receptor [Comamonadaceae bacterium]
MSHLFRPGILGAAFLALAHNGVEAQTAPDTSPPGSLREVTVTGNPLGATGLIAPTESVSGDALLLRSQGTLGQTLDGLPGVSSSYFGPNASRPIVRGQDGDRIRILQNGGASLDASSLSYDHAVPVDALVTERVEVLRGPSALQYGGSAVGGVVNVIDNRIPSEPVGGFGGRVELGGATGNRERSGGVLLEGGNDRFALHADYFRRDTDDVRVPIELGCEKPGSPALARRICNSASRSEGGALGGTAFFDQGWLGASVSTYRSRYGTVAEDDVSIDMRSDRYALEGEWRLPGGFFTVLHGKFGHTDYGHTEFEGAQTGTVFAQRGNALELTARHRPVAGIEGVIGFQSERSRFSADGEEAFAPHSRTRTSALFLHEELATGWGRLSFGARAERVKVASLGSPDPEIARFPVLERSFDPRSAALGGLVRLDAQWQLTANLAYTERAPKDYELFANGPHVATAAWEVGNAALEKERSIGVDVGAEWKSGPNRARVNLYASRFRNYIGLGASGNVRGESGELNPGAEETPDGPLLPDVLDEYVYRGVRARFTGLEASGNLRLIGRGGWFGAAGGDESGEGERSGRAPTLDLEWRGDLVRATDRDSGQPLPRIAPARVGGTLVYGQGPWSARVGFDAIAAQRRVPALGQRVTDGYTLWNAALTYRQRVARANLTWFARLDNIGNKLAYTATSILSTTAFPDAPLPGRSLKLGLRATF